MIFRTNKITNYTKIDNRYLEDKNISLKAKGLLTLTLCPSLLGVKNYSQNKPYRNQYQKYCYKHYLN